MAQVNEYTIDLNRMPIGAHRYEYTLDDAFFDAFDSTEIKGGTIQADVELMIREMGCAIHLRVDGNVRITCDRCLDDMLQPVTADEMLLVKIGVQEEDVMEEALYVDPQVGTLDIAWLLYEMITINLPIVHSHQMGECNPQMEELLRTHLCTTMEEPEE